MDISQMNSSQLNEVRMNLIRNIMNTDCNILDISHRYGATSYIDFITRHELGGNKIMKGYDDFARPFIVFKAEIIYNDSNYNQKIYTTFTTFFKRYADDDLLWTACGHDGALLFDTVGGANVEQLKLLDELLKNGYVDLTPDMDYKNLRLYPFGVIDISKLQPIKIKLGYNMIQ